MARLYATYMGCITQPKERIYRTREDAFHLDDDCFIDLFRLNKVMVRNLCQDLRLELEPVSRINTVLSVETQVLCALRFYATGSYQKSVAQDLLLTLSQASVSRCIKRVSAAIVKNLLHREVTFPAESEYPNIKKEFREKSGFPGVIGAIDCTQIPIIAPPVPLEEAYVNRKGYHSINVQLVCDSNLKILNVNAKYPGKTHDSFIWRYSLLREILEQDNQNRTCTSWFLGDSGYPLEPWLMTPIMSPRNNAERRYNAALSKGRVYIEDCNGVLKGRFRCLHRHRVLNYDPTTASNIINSCVVLHNMCIKNRLSFELDDSDTESDSESNSDDEEFITEHNENATARCARNQIIQNHFT